MNLGPHPSADTPRRVSGHVASWLEGDPAWAIADRIFWRRTCSFWSSSFRSDFWRARDLT